jgi:AcrR family transcriptional regulator
MARQVRSEVTRRKIIDAAIDVFGEVGYPAALWGTIIERTGMTKGALYHHFDSKESLASAIIEEGAETLLNAFRNAGGPSSPGLENLLHGTFMIAKVLSSDKIACATEQLTFALSGFNEAASRSYANLIAEMAAEARRAVQEGDLREDVDPEVVSKLVVGTMSGMRLLSNVGVGADRGEQLVGDLSGPLRQVWELLLPGISSESSLAYFRQFLLREERRRPTPSPDTAGETEIGEGSA